MFPTSTLRVGVSCWTTNPPHVCPRRKRGLKSYLYRHLFILYHVLGMSRCGANAKTKTNKSRKRENISPTFKDKPWLQPTKVFSPLHKKQQFAVFETSKQATHFLYNPLKYFVRRCKNIPWNQHKPVFQKNVLQSFPLLLFFLIFSDSFPQTLNIAFFRNIVNLPLSLSSVYQSESFRRPSPNFSENEEALSSSF